MIKVFMDAPNNLPVGLCFYIAVKSRITITMFNQLNTRNHRITELSNVLQYLVKDRSICDTDTCCDLLYKYLDELKTHINQIELSIYPTILKHGSAEDSNTLNNFMNGSQEIKRIIRQYKRRWCNQNTATLKIKNHADFIAETDQLFSVVLQRLQDETEKLYPMARKLVR